jgi:5-methylcytosine-specific restriction endonuclease McrA
MSEGIIRIKDGEVAEFRIVSTDGVERTPESFEMSMLMDLVKGYIHEVGMEEFYDRQSIERSFARRFGTSRYSTRVAHAYDGDLERAECEGDDQVAARVAAWEKAHGMPVLDWTIEHHYGYPDRKRKRTKSHSEQDPCTTCRSSDRRMPLSHRGVVTPDPYKSQDYRRNRLAVLEAAGWRCQICGAQAATADHVLPLALGGSHDVSNLRPLCRRCNSRLGADLANEIKARRRYRSAVTALVIPVSAFRSIHVCPPPMRPSYTRCH